MKILYIGVSNLIITEKRWIGPSLCHISYPNIRIILGVTGLCAQLNLDISRWDIHSFSCDIWCYSK